MYLSRGDFLKEILGTISQQADHITPLACCIDLAQITGNVIHVNYMQMLYWEEFTLKC